jgi:hypothetical protein
MGRLDVPRKPTARFCIAVALVAGLVGHAWCRDDATKAAAAYAHRVSPPIGMPLTGMPLQSIPSSAVNVLNSWDTASQRRHRGISMARGESNFNRLQRPGFRPIDYSAGEGPS